MIDTDGEGHMGGVTLGIDWEECLFIYLTGIRDS